MAVTATITTTLTAVRESEHVFKAIEAHNPFSSKKEGRYNFCVFKIQVFNDLSLQSIFNVSKEFYKSKKVANSLKLEELLPVE